MPRKPRISWEEAENKIKPLLDQGMTIANIAKSLNYSVGGIVYWIKKLKLQPNYTHKPIITPELGATFGKWEYLGEEQNRLRKNSKYNEKFWKCKCKCGYIKYVAASSLVEKIGGRSNGCGCIWNGKEWVRKRYGHEEITGSYMSAVRIGAKERNIQFKVEEKYLWELFIRQNRKCAISGVELKFATNRLKGEEESKKYFKEQTASLDRIDSSMGYIEGNVWWVHKDFNKMKNSYDMKTFLDYIKIIYEYQHNVLGNI